MANCVVVATAGGWGRILNFAVSNGGLETGSLNLESGSLNLESGSLNLESVGVYVEMDKKFLDGLLLSARINGGLSAARDCVEHRSLLPYGSPVVSGVSKLQQQKLSGVSISSPNSPFLAGCRNFGLFGAALFYPGRSLSSESRNGHDSRALASLRRQTFGRTSSGGRQGQGCPISCYVGEGTESNSSTRSKSSAEEQRHQELSQPYGILATSVPKRFDVVGLGLAMVDFSASVTDDFLNSLGLIKGTRKVVNCEERGRFLRALDGCSYKLTAGGSLSNTLVALARLGKGYNNGDLPLKVAMTGSVGKDALGDFYRQKLSKANVDFLSEPIEGGTTGTVIVCTTPDAQRTMLSYQGMSSILNLDEYLEYVISMSKIFVVEGYFWELEETVEIVVKACRKAKDHGVLVALTASDVSCVNRHSEKMWDVIGESADILFANAGEARALLGCDDSMSPASAAKMLSKCCPLVSVTDGVQGSYIGLKREISYIHPASCVPVDTCGAGDAYAAGVLYGVLKGVPDLKGIGNLAARVAAVVVGQQGTRLKEEDARDLATSIPTGDLATSIPTVPLEGLNFSMNMHV